MRLAPFYIHQWAWVVYICMNAVLHDCSRLRFYWNPERCVFDTVWNRIMCITTIEWNNSICLAFTRAQCTFNVVVVSMRFVHFEIPLDTHTDGASEIPSNGRQCECESLASSLLSMKIDWYSPATASSHNSWLCAFVLTKFYCMILCLMQCCSQKCWLGGTIYFLRQCRQCLVWPLNEQATNCEREMQSSLVIWLYL